MCWSWQVSLISSSLEWLCAYYLWSRALKLDRQYATFIGTIATMETLQFTLWLCIDGGYESANIFFSVLIWADAWLLVPWSIVNIAPTTLPCSWGCYRKTFFAAYFGVQGIFVLLLMMFSRTWSTAIGPNHHQVWPCSAALAWAGAYPFCIGTCVAYVLMVALAIRPQEYIELYPFICIGVASFVPTYALLGASLEACSVWCWTAGSYGAYFVLRPRCTKILLAYLPQCTPSEQKELH